MQYFYHPDHLGSASFVTDREGAVCQHIQYLPFGELFVSQKNSEFDSRYKFTAKELDNETSYTYFGARYYDSDLSVWLSVDPMSDKYPSTSAYMYCVGNPVVLVDPNGDTTNYYDSKSGEYLGTIYGSSNMNDRMISKDKYNELMKIEKTYTLEGFKIKENLIDNDNKREALINGSGYTELLDLNNDIGLLARIGYSEMRGGNYLEKAAVMDIVLNRSEKNKLSIEDIIKQPYQFSSLTDNNKEYFYNPYAKARENKENFDAWVSCMSAAISVKNGSNRGLTQGATLYFSPRSMINNSLPNWNFKSLQEIEVNGIRKNYMRMFK